MHQQYMHIPKDDPRLAAALNCHNAAMSLIRRGVLPHDPEWKRYREWADSVCKDRHKINPKDFGVN